MGGERRPDTIRVPAELLPGYSVELADETTDKSSKIPEWLKKQRRVIAGIAMLGIAGTVFTVYSGDHDEQSTSKQHASTKADAKDGAAAENAASYLPPRLACEPVATVAINSRAPIEWHIPNVPISGPNVFPDLGRGSVTIDSCVGNVIDNFDESTSKKTGVKTFTISPEDIQFKLDLTDYQNGFPDYESDEIMAAMEKSNPNTDTRSLEPVVTLLQDTISSFDDERQALHLEALKKHLIDEYGPEIVDTALRNAQIDFDTNAEKADLTVNQVQLRPQSNLEVNSLSFVDTVGVAVPKADELPFTYEDTQSNDEIKLMKKKAQE